MINLVPIEYKRSSGIYKITNTVDDRFYIGSAVELWDRCRTHRIALLAKNHYNDYLQRFVDKYGIDKLKFELVELVYDRFNLLTFEQYYLDLWQVFKREFGFNICPKAGSTLGVPISEETRKKISDAQSGSKSPKFGKPINPVHQKMMLEARRQPIIQYALDGSFVKRWESLSEASKEGFNNTCITMCCRGKNKTHNGFLWKYDGEPKQKDTSNCVRHCSDQLREKYSLERGERIGQYLLDGSLVKIWNSANEPYKKTKQFFQQNISRALSNGKPYKNFYWRRLPKDICDYQPASLNLPILL